MFDQYFNPNIPFVAIDLADRSIKAARAEIKGGKYEIIGVGRMDLPEGLMLEGRVQDSHKLAETLRNFFKSEQGRALRAPAAALTLPEEHCFVKISYIPVLPDIELEQAIRWEAESVIPLPPGEAVISWEVLGPSSVKENHLDVLIAGVPRDLATSYADLLRSIPMIPVVFEPESFSIARSLVGEEDTGPMLLIDLGHEHTGVIITQGHHVRVTANIPIAAKTFTERIAEVRNIKIEEAEDIKRKHGIVKETKEGLANRKVLEPVIDELVHQVHDFFSYFETHGAGEKETALDADRRINKVILAGGDAKLRGLPEYIAEGLNVPVEVGDPFKGVVADKKIPRHPLYASAIGLSMYRVDTNRL